MSGWCKHTTTGTYSVRVHCSNCGATQRIEILRGKPIKATSCPNCGCLSLSKAFG